MPKTLRPSVSTHLVALTFFTGLATASLEYLYLGAGTDAQMNQPLATVFALLMDGSGAEKHFAKMLQALKSNQTMCGVHRLFGELNNYSSYSTLLFASSHPAEATTVSLYQVNGAPNTTQAHCLIDQVKHVLNHLHDHEKAVWGMVMGITAGVIALFCVGYMIALYLRGNNSLEQQPLLPKDPEVATSTGEIRSTPRSSLWKTLMPCLSTSSKADKIELGDAPGARL